MASIVDRTHLAYRGTVHPFQAAVLAGTIPLFLGALLSDWAYWSTYQIQWSNFASWLIVGALVFGAIALACAVIDLFHAGRRNLRSFVYTLLLLALWVLGFINALVHAKDAWGMMPGGLVLSVIVTILACAVTWMAFSGLRTGAAR